METIGKRLKSLRQKKDISMAQLADSLDLDISPSTISNIENEKHSPNAEIVIALAKYFEVTTDYLLLGKGFGTSFAAPSIIREAKGLYLDEDEIGTIKELINFIKQKKKYNQE